MGLLCVSKLFPAFLFFFSWRGCGKWGVGWGGVGWGGLVSTLLFFFPFILGSQVFRTINNKVPFLDLEYTNVAVL